MIYYILPKGIVYLGTDISNPSQINPRVLYQGTQDGYPLTVSIRNISQDIISFYEQSLNTNLSPNQILFEVEFGTDIADPNVSNAQLTLEKHLMLALLLAHKSHSLVHMAPHHKTYTPISKVGPGLSLPYAFNRVVPQHKPGKFYINTFYDTNSGSVQFGYNTLIDDPQINGISSHLNNLLSKLNASTISVKEVTLDIFLHSSTMSWHGGDFFIAIMSMFACFENILRKTNVAEELGYILGSPEHTLLKDFQYFRNGVAHLSSYDIDDLGGGNFRATPYNTAHNTVEFSRDKLMDVRGFLIDTIISNI